MRKRIYFVRHAEAHSNVDPLHGRPADDLTDSGIAQAKALASRFASIPVDAIYSSDILRAKQTAAEIGVVTGRAPIELGFLGERKGAWLEATRFDASESFEGLVARLAKAKAFLEGTEGKHVVVVSHAIFLKAMAAYLMLGDALANESLGRIGDLLVADNAGVSLFLFNTEKGKWRLWSWNDKAHLAE